MALDRAKSSYQQELERKSNDLLIVYNPTDQRYLVEWDKRGGVKLFPIEAKSEAVFPRYIANRYIKAMYQQMLNDKAKEAIFKENQRRISVGMAEMDKTMKTNEQMAFEEKFYNPSSEEARKIIALLYVGIQTEFGVDRMSPQTTKVDDTPVLERTLKSVQEEKDSKTYVDTTNGEKTQENTLGEASGTQNDYKCGVCSFVAKSNIGLVSHMRTHRDELEQKKADAVSKVSKI
jgi:hypothetical protein